MPNWSVISQHVQRLIFSQNGLVEEFRIDGKPYAGTRTTLRRADYESDAGLVEGDYQFSLLCPTAQFEKGIPAPRTTKVCIKGQEFRLLSVDADAIGATVRLNLGSVLA